jgi:hypothetical protein
VGTTLAVLERTLKTMSAIQARIHYSMKQEFQLLKDIIRDYTPSEYGYEPEEGDRQVKQADYDMVYVLPVSDPNAATMAQKVVQYQAALQLAQTAPQLYDLPLLHRQMLDVLGIKNYQKLVPMPSDQKPVDPISENQNILKGKPVKAFLQQDHQAHIIVHQSAMNDPQVQQLVGMNPQIAQQLQAAMSAHIMEHLGFEYRKQLEQQMGITLPAYVDPDDVDAEPQVLPAEMESRIAQMAAQASQQLLQQHVQQAQAQKNAQMAQDPIIQMQQQELMLKAQDQKRKEQKDLTDAQIAAKKLALEEQRIQAQQVQAGAQLAVKAKSDIMKTKVQEKQHGINTAVDVQKHIHGQNTTAMNTFNQQEHERKLAEMQHNLQARLAERQNKPKE